MAIDYVYKGVVAEIRNLPWKDLDEIQLVRLMYISYIAAQEFAEALRIALRLHPADANLQEMARGELKTNNLRFADYDQRGDHSEFLGHFLMKIGFVPDAVLQTATHEYVLVCRSLPQQVRAATVFSREAELGGIFDAILLNGHWGDSEALSAFQYYLRRHIELDGEHGGHADLVSEYPIGDEVFPFYLARRTVYDAIPELRAREP